MYKKSQTMVLEFNADRMAPAVESTPHANAMIFKNAHEGATPITDFMDDNSMDTEARGGKGQTGEEIPLLSTSGYLLPVNPMA